MEPHSRRTLGTVIYLAAVLLGLALAIVAMWGDFEAASYFNTGASYAAFSGLNCPVVMSRSEVATVSATFDNPTSRESEPYYVVAISGTAASRSLDDHIQVPAHSSRTVSWSVSANDIDLGYFVMNKLDILASGGSPAREATCGIVVLNLGPWTGGQFLGAGLGLSLLGMVAGLGLGEASKEALDRKRQSIRNGMRAAGVATLLGLLTGLMGVWLLSVVFCAITILLLAILLRVATT